MIKVLEELILAEIDIVRWQLGPHEYSRFGYRIFSFGMNMPQIFYAAVQTQLQTNRNRQEITRNLVKVLLLNKS